MENTPHFIEVALLLLVTFLVGCVIGYYLRRMLSSGAGEAPAGTVPAETSVAPATAASEAAAAESVTSGAPAAAAKPKAPAKPKAAAKPKVSAKPKSASAKSAPATKAKPAAKQAAKSPAKPAAAKSAAAKAAKPAAKPKPAAKSAAKPAAADDGKPEALTAPREGKKDDLKKIKGIGPKLEGTLNDLGIYHYDQIAGWKRKTVNWVDDHLSFKGRIDREDWIKQAKALAKAK